MRHLLLLRHAKSSWDDLDLSDHDRPLAPRGVRATALLSEHLRGADPAPELVLCSSAQRTRDTLEGIRDSLPANVDVSVEDELYGASGDGLLARVRTVDDGVTCVMLIGHNPGIADLARSLVADPHPLSGKYPTGALATLSFGGTWRELRPGEAELAGFVTPKQLASR